MNSNSYNISQLSEMERMIISRNLCKAFLNMSCVFAGEEVEIVYETAGYVKIADYFESAFIDKNAVLTVCRCFLEVLICCREHLIECEELSFREEDLYYSPEDKTMKMRFLPGFRNETGVREKLVSIVDSAARFCSGADSIIEPLSAYKKRLYMGPGELGAMLEITEKFAGKNIKADSSPKGAEETVSNPLRSAKNTAEITTKTEKNVPKNRKDYIIMKIFRLLF